MVKSPLKSIKEFCREDCMAGSWSEVKQCTTPKCSLYHFRFGRKQSKVSVLKAIREKCMDCSGQEQKHVRECKFKDCLLYHFRTGHNPNLKGKRGGTAEHMKAIKIHNPQ